MVSINTLGDIGASAETFLALSSHGAVLKDLKICLSSDSLAHISLLGGCTTLETLRIEDVHATTVLEETHKDTFLETIEWLRKCENLQTLAFPRFLSAPALLTPILLEHKIKLRHLEVDSYVLNENRQFHQALVHQKDSLAFLSLSGETDGMFRDDLDIIVDALQQLVQLKTLRLLLQEVFREEHLILIIRNLSLLEELCMYGLELNDRILEFVGNLGNLRSATLGGISKFTTDGLLEFISRLGPGNQGIRVMIDQADPETLLPDEELALVRESLMERVEGTMDYIPTRGKLQDGTLKDV